MTTAFSFPAEYVRVVESALALAGAEIGRDVKYRALGQTGDVTDTWAPIATELLEPSLSGRITIVIVPDGCTESPDHLHAFATPARG